MVAEAVKSGYDEGGMSRTLPLKKSNFPETKLYKVKTELDDEKAKVEEPAWYTLVGGGKTHLSRLQVYCCKKISNSS